MVIRPSEKVLILMSHPDDEVAFGWPILQDPAIDKEVLICAANQFRNEAGNLTDGSKALMGLCDSLGVRCRCLGFEGRFSLADPMLSGYFAQHIVSVASATSCDVIYTHNPWGESGHPDHRAVSMAALHTEKPVAWSDMCIKTGAWPTPIAPRLRRAWLKGDGEQKVLDIAWYDACKRFYDDNGSWTWPFPAVESCRTYRLDP